MSEEVSKLLRADLVRLELTQEEFANKLGVTQQAVSAWCARNAIPHRRLKAIENALGRDSELVAYMRDVPQLQVLRDRSTEFRAIREQPRRVPSERSTQGTSLARPNIFTQMQLEQQRFRELIENELPGTRVNTLVHVGLVNRQFDYISPSLCIALISLTPLEGRMILASQRVYTHLVSLMLCRQVTREEHPERLFGIIVVADDPNFETTPHVSRLQWECEQFDVSLSVVPHIDEAAKLILQIENSFSKDYESDI